MNHLLQITSDNQLLVAYGPLGIICAWFMWRNEKLITEIRTLSHRIDGMTRAMLAETLGRENTTPGARKVAQDMLNRIESRESKGR